jgi:hypothetical protein
MDDGQPSMAGGGFLCTVTEPISETNRKKEKKMGSATFKPQPEPSAAYGGGRINEFFALLPSLSGGC